MQILLIPVAKIAEGLGIYDFGVFVDIVQAAVEGGIFGGGGGGA